MRRRHFVDSDARRTMCGHDMTDQEMFHAKKCPPHHINCKKCMLIGRHK